VRATREAREILRELGYGLSSVLPFARAGANGQADAADALAYAKGSLDLARRIEVLPWQATLEVSADHLTAAEIEGLRQGESPHPFNLSMANDHAWLLHVPPSAESASLPAPLGVGLASLFAFAIQHGFRYVRVDEDVAPLPGVAIQQGPQPSTCSEGQE